MSRPPPAVWWLPPSTKKPFTFILETERGLNLSIQAVPREGAGRTIQLVSDLRGTGEEAGAWETSTPYESLLVTISQGRPWRKITRRLVSGPSDKGNPAGPRRGCLQWQMPYGRGIT